VAVVLLAIVVGGAAELITHRDGHGGGATAQASVAQSATRFPLASRPRTAARHP
jgi:hypothetical protein